MPNIVKFVALIGIVALVILVNYYLLKKLYPLVNVCIPNCSKTAYYIVCFLFIAVMMLATSKGLLPLPQIFEDVICSLSSRWMGLFIYLLMYSVLSDLLLLAGKTFKLLPSDIPDNVKVAAAALILIGATLTNVLGEAHAYNIYVKPYEISIENTSLDDMSIVMVSDIHLGAEDSEKRLPKIIDTINSLDADVVCIAGDIFDNDFYAIRDTDEVKRQLMSIKSRYGVYACLGNHDCGSSFSEMLTFLDECGIKLLNDDYAVIGDKINLVGRVDADPIGNAETITRTEYSKILEKIDNDLPIIVMEHNPSSTEEYGKETALVLSGHTHEGQIFPGNLIVHYMYKEKAYGYSLLKDGAQLIVSSGAGTWGMPIRVGTDCEVVDITLK